VGSLLSGGSFTDNASITLIGCNTADGGDKSLAKQVEASTGLKTIGTCGKPIFSRRPDQNKWNLSE